MTVHSSCIGCVRQEMQHGWRRVWICEHVCHMCSSELCGCTLKALAGSVSSIHNILRSSAALWVQLSRKWVLPCKTLSLGPRNMHLCLTSWHCMKTQDTPATG